MSGWFRAAPVVFLLLWSAGFTVAGVGLAYAEPLTFVVLRYALILAVLLTVLAGLRPGLPWGAGPGGISPWSECWCSSAPSR